jgi:hypothetical protein
MGVAMLIPEGTTAAVRRVVSPRDDATGLTQQQMVQERFRQHEREPDRGAWPPVAAEASLTRQDIPTIARKATRPCRRW